MNPVRLIFCIHNHQPTGNFDSVNEQSYRDAYRPILDLAAEYPDFRFAMHTSGCLLEWLEANHPDYLDKLNGMVERGQVELVGGAMYEPILPVWPAEQVAAQIDAYTNSVQRRFGVTPTAFWLPERVWEPHLALTLADCGVRALPVDDAMVTAAGVLPDDLYRPLSTGPADKPIRLLPVPERLRYTIPFRPVAESLAFLQEAGVSVPGAVITYADDGEKFGSWPGTHHHVFGRGWMRRFIEQVLAASSWLQLTHFGDVMTESPTTHIALPAGTYREMSEWAEAAGSEGAALQRFADGTNWRNFLTKYSEADRLHTTVLDFARQKTDDHVLRAQCNCAYWHGVFGGVYLPHLRSALYEELARSRASAPSSAPVVKTEKAVYLANKGLCLRCTPATGGMLDTILQYDPPFNWGCTLTRRPEAYHEKLRRGSKGTPRGPGSVHSSRGVRGSNFEGLLMYDAYERASLLDHFFKSTGLISRFATGELEDTGDFIGQPYEITESDDTVALTRDGVVRFGGRSTQVQIAKAIQLEDEHTFEVKYNIKALGALEGRFGVEWNLTALAPTGPDRWVEVNGDQGGEPKSRKRYSGVRQFGIVDAWSGKAIRIDVSPSCDLWRFGLHTVSQSERSYQQVYQQTVFMAHWPLTGVRSLEAVFKVQLQKL